MATEAPDPRTFASWDDAFRYPIPVVRKLEHQLRGNAGENREKLRSLVGTSYRDLLSTAETIIDMELRMQKVESSLARVGQTCNSRQLDRITRNVAASNAHNRERHVFQYTFASQLSVLRSCPVVVDRLMQSEGSYLLIAKVLVISRLLHKALSQERDGYNKPAIVEQLRDRLGALRGKLLRGIDRRMAAAAQNDNSGVEELVETMCAYSLATSSTPTDVLRHFHHVRTEAIISALRPGKRLKANGVSALKLCLQTCLDTTFIFPRRLADALARLKVQSLAQDPDVRALYELNLDVHERWIGDEARTYTPQPRHNELKRPEAESMLHQWSRQIIQAFLKGIKNSLGETNDLKEVAELRQELIETWILSGSRMAGVKSKNVLDNLRDTMNEHLETIMRSRAQQCKAVTEQIATTLSSWDDKHTTTLSLWTSTPAARDLPDGARTFKEKILNTHQGRDAPVIGVLNTFDNWIESILEVKTIIRSMKETRWDDPFSDDVDLDDSDDDFGTDSKQALLSDDDPRLLEGTTQEAIQQALTLLGQSLEQIVSGLNTSSNAVQNISKIMFVLRAVRDINDHIPRLRLNDKASSPPSPFAKNMLALLHTTLAEEVAKPLVQSYLVSLHNAVKARPKNHILWEGQPPLPAQPTSSTFRLLSQLVKSMAAHGSDLWAPEGVQMLKKIASNEITKVWTEVFETINSTSGSSSKPTESVETDSNTETEAPHAASASVETGSFRMERLTQLLFDIFYVQRNLSKGNEELTDAIAGAVGMDQIALGRLQKNAGDYARKTYLLFALLA